MPFFVAARTLEVLEWPLLLAALADHTRTARGAARCVPPEVPDAAPEAWGFAGDGGEADRLLAETGEARRLLDAGQSPGFGGLVDLADALARSRRDGVLTAHELLDLATALAVFWETRRFLARRAEDAPQLAERAEGLADLRELEEAILFHIDSEGQARHQASPLLAQSRREARRLAGELQSRLARLLSDPEVSPALSDQFTTQRNDRYVLPVRADARGRVPGIVHDASGSGTTLFIEPQAVVDLNNRLKSAELEVERETRRILRELSQRVAQRLGEIEASLEALETLDLAFARGRLSQAQRACAPEVGEAGVFRLLEARHPLIPPDEAVPNDLRLGEGAQVLVISGPNAGGKTVALKTVALAALMLRAGMHVPVAEGSRLDRVSAVLADIGDAQDLREHLSTFSAHLANLASIVRAADARSLVVLDEVGVGTDPSEGAALAQATLETLADAGARVVTTTHYNLLKEMAGVDPRFENASVEFDPETLAPTYRLRTGSAGASSAITVAARMGLAQTVLDRANALLEREDRRLDRILVELSSSRAALETERREAAELREQSEQARSEYRAKLERLQERRDKLFASMRGDLEDAFRNAHADVAAVIRDLQRRGSAQGAAHARERLLSLEARVKQAEQSVHAETPAPTPEPQAEAIDWQHAAPGDTVRIGGRRDATLLALPDRRGRVAVQVGSARMQVPREQLSRAADSPPAKPRPTSRVATPAARGGSGHRCDLRGLRVDEALNRVAEELDRAALAGRDRIVFVHGLGSGALRDAVREQLRDSPYLARFSPADQDEGGDGVTIAELRG